MASFTSYKIDFTPRNTNNFWRVELLARLIKNGDPVLPGEELEKTLASKDVVRAEFSLALTCPQVEEIRRGRSIAKTWSKLEDIFEYYGPASEAPLFRQVAHQCLDGRPEMIEMLQGFLDEIDEVEDANPSCPSPLTVLRNLVTNPTLFQLRKKITGRLDPLGLLCGVEQLCGCNPYVPKDESHNFPTDCLYCKYDIPSARAVQGSNPSEEGKITRDRDTDPIPVRAYYADKSSKADRGKPYLKTELLSIFKLTASEKHIIFKRDEATVISHAGDVKLRATREGAKVFKMELDGVKTQPPDYADFATWHRRLGHIDYRDLHYGHKQFAFRGLKLLKPGKTDSPSCSICQAVKLPGWPLRPAPQVKTQVLEIIHADFCGPIPGQSKDAANFFITFTDDASGWISMYFIRHRTEILKFFQEYETLAESQLKEKIRSLQTNDGLGRSFEEYLKAKDIERLKIPTDTQHVRALLETTKCILMQSGLDDSFYCEALNTACYIRNRSSSVRLDGLTPYQIWYGRPPSLRHMHEFGTKVTCVARKDPDKGTAETKQGQYLGFTKKDKAYRIWIPDYQQIVLSDEVQFHDYVKSRGEDGTRAERQRSDAGGGIERPGTSTDSGEAKNSGTEEKISVIPRSKKTRTKYSRYDSKLPDYGFSRGPPKYDKNIHDYIRGKCSHFHDDSSDEDSDSDLEEEGTIYEEDELDTLEKGNESDEDAERRIVTVKRVTDSTRKQSTSAEPPAEDVGPGAIPKDKQRAPGLEGTRTPSIPIMPKRLRDN